MRTMIFFLCSFRFCFLQVDEVVGGLVREDECDEGMNGKHSPEENTSAPSQHDIK